MLTRAISRARGLPRSRGRTSPISTAAAVRRGFASASAVSSANALQAAALKNQDGNGETARRRVICGSGRGSCAPRVVPPSAPRTALQLAADTKQPTRLPLHNHHRHLRRAAMFCQQCEQTEFGKGCTTVGVCGKTPEVRRGGGRGENRALSAHITSLLGPPPPPAAAQRAAHDT